MSIKLTKLGMEYYVLVDNEDSANTSLCYALSYNRIGNAALGPEYSRLHTEILDLHEVLITYLETVDENYRDRHD